MRYISFIFSTAVLFLSGCASLDCKPITGSTLQGTETAVVGIYIDNSGYPQASVDKVRVYPGQKIVFIGPSQFDILFKNQQSPIGKLEVSSSNGIVTLEIPRDIFEQSRRTGTVEVRELLYQYGIRVNGKITDPTIIVDRR